MFNSDATGFEGEDFAVMHALPQLVGLTGIPDKVNYHRNIVDSFLTSDPNKYAITVNASLGKSKQSHITA